MTVDGAGNLYVAEYNNNTIRKMTPAGTNWVVTTLAGKAGSSGSTDGTNSDARFNIPQGVAVDMNGNVYVRDARSRKLDSRLDQHLYGGSAPIQRSEQRG